MVLLKNETHRYDINFKKVVNGLPQEYVGVPHGILILQISTDKGCTLGSQAVAYIVLCAEDLLQIWVIFCGDRGTMIP